MSLLATRRGVGFLLVTFLLGTGASPASAQVPAPIQGSSRPRPEELRSTADGQGRVQPNLPVFEFHSGLWINLHHFLYQQARQARPSTEQQPLAKPPVPPTKSLTPEEQRAWQESLEYYTNFLAGQDLLFNGDMVAIKDRLAEMEGEANLQKSGLRPDLVAALERAAPIYRAQWWPEHDRSNRDWVTGVAPLVEQLSGRLAQRLAEVYEAKWPEGRIRVDLSYYANWAGAYTTLDPLHITISSSDARNQGLAALEMLFHEASHALAGAVREGIARECRTRNKPIPRDLWHALIFYTTGEIVRRTLGGPDGALARPAAGSPAIEYTPYAYRQGLYQRGWQNYLRVLERHWLAYLDGRTDYDSAVARLVNAL